MHHSINAKRKKLGELYDYLFIEEVAEGKTRHELFCSDRLDLIDDSESYMFAMMDIELMEDTLSSFKRIQEKVDFKNQIREIENSRTKK